LEELEGVIPLGELEGAISLEESEGVFRVKNEVQPIIAGDGETFGWITDIAPRRNYIIRRASNLSKQSHILASNVDQCLLLVTVDYPETSTTFIDRFLATAEAYRIPVHIVIGKADLYDESRRRIANALAALYTGLGYPCHIISLTEPPLYFPKGRAPSSSPEGMAPSNSPEGGENSLPFGEGWGGASFGKGWDGAQSLLPSLEGRTTLLSGNSGVGKSTLLNALVPGRTQKTAEISDAHNKGMHTTAFSEMFALPTSGWLIDTPGVKGFGTFDMEREEISHYFRELFAFSSNCRYGNCTHTHEPDCAVLQALSEQRIAPSRYASYLSMLDDKDESKYR
jgi:ribosome biogenesis GTPase